MPSTGCSSSLNESVPSFSKTISWTRAPARFVMRSVSGLGRTSTESAPTVLRTGRVTARSESAGDAYAASHDRRIDGERVLEADRLQRDAKASLAGGPHVELRRLASGGDGLRVDARGAEGGDEQDGDALKRTPAS